MISNQRLGILVGGGPAPGINSALGAATIEAIKMGAEVIGIYDGFEHVINGRTDMIRPLEYPDVSRIHFQGGSIIRTSRANPTRSEADLERTVDTLKELGVSHLITIGGEDTASASARLSQQRQAGIRIAHIPKTIDNDLPLPGNAPTFGFETARHLGTQWVLNLMEESRTTNRWCLVVVMGRKAGHLALGIGKAAGAIVTVIPEDFALPKISLGDLCLVLEGAIIKRRSLGRQDGLAVIAEGVAAKMDPAELATVSGFDVGYDAHGNIRLEKIPLASIIEREMVRRCSARGESLPLVSVTLGYELRCAAPIPFDIDYTRTLGYGAVRFLFGQGGTERTPSGGIVCLDNGRLRVLPFEELQDPDTGRIRTRMVDTKSEHYVVAREYMVRLGRRDLSDRATARKLADAAGTELEDFVTRFSPAVESDTAERTRVRASA
ncbi:MAG TPA: diphosphate--fructose-6-phosphate 1-phosphotransferase [Dehalococcoidia bacterium]|nr:diphosphate--fructose-6-phosphate 1-phosphotransferase [Dehalococcoidia bacterium]